MSAELTTIIDLIRYGASRFNAAGLTFGHSYDNALDEATQLTVIAESEQLRNQRPEDIVRIHMRVNENGMEWQTLQRDDGTIERKLVSE